MAATAELFGRFKGSKCVFCEVAKECEGVMLCGGEKVGFSERLLPSAKPAKETFVGGQSGVEVGSMHPSAFSLRWWEMNGQLRGGIQLEM